MSEQHLNTWSATAEVIADVLQKIPNVDKDERRRLAREGLIALDVMLGDMEKECLRLAELLRHAARALET